LRRIEASACVFDAIGKAKWSADGGAGRTCAASLLVEMTK
jgi:hypothetical protein